jgi:hypothetical protein
VHRLKVRLARRCRNIPLAGPATALLERAGVRATYRLHDALLSNPSSRKLFATEPPRLDPAQAEVVNSLSAEGYALVPFRRLVPDPAVWDRLTADAAAFTEQAVRDLAAEKEALAASGAPDRKKEKKLKKSYLRRRYGREVELTLDDPWLRFGVSPAMLDIVNSYLGLWSKLIYIDQWYTVPTSAESERIASQRWHRDYNDQHLVKVFIYLSDVDEGAGPLEYVPGSARGGRYANEWRWDPLSETYPPADEFDRRIPPSAAKTLVGPAGSVIFCNTSGFHRGGFATERPRVMWVYNYVSKASLASLSERNFRVDPDGFPPDLPPAARYALT